MELNEHESQVGTTLVYATEWLSIWWNGSATFNVWRNGVEVDVFTRYNVSNLSEAFVAANTWVIEERVAE